MSNNQWNPSYTLEIRKQRPDMWGNWSLEPMKPGTMGILMETTQFFDIKGQLSGNQSEETMLSEAWELQSSGVSQKKAKVDIHGKTVEASGNIGITWDFKKSHSVVSKFHLSKQMSLKEGAIKNNMDAIIAEAKKAGMYKEGFGIIQGFGVVTEVLYASSGVNLGSRSSDSSFTLEGSAKGVAEMFEGGADASYSQTTSTKSIDHTLWPDAPKETTNTLVPVAYKLCSFHGELIIPTWVCYHTDFIIELDNNHGGTYIVNCKISYTVDGETKEKKTQIWGGGKDIVKIPLNAQNVKLTIDPEDGKSGTTYEYECFNPLVQWVGGKASFDIYGVWPGRFKVEKTIRD